MVNVIAAAIAKVAPSTRNNRVVEPVHAKIAPATANPVAPASMPVAATMALALPTCPVGTKMEIAAWRAGCTRALIDASTNRIGTIHHNQALISAGVVMRIAALM